MTIVRSTLLMIAALSLLGVAPSPRALAQTGVIEYSEEAEGLFAEGVTLYRLGQYRDASRMFSRVIDEFPTSHRVSAAYVMKGKANAHLRDYLEAARVLRAFLSAFPSSSYLPDAHLTLGSVYERVGRYGEALEEYRAAWRSLPQPPPPKLNRQLIAALDTLIDNDLQIDLLHRTLTQSTIPEERAFFWLKIGEKEAASDNTMAAMVALDTLGGIYAGLAPRERVDRLREKLAARGSVTLGVLMPLMQKSEPSAVKELGNEVYAGIAYAVEQYMQDPATRIKVRLDVRDTERDQALAAQEAGLLAGNDDVIGIIGPVFSATVSAAALQAQALGVPLVSPTANANGIAATGNYVFQANPDYETRGRAMARYAVQGKGYSRLAVLAPEDTYGKFLAEGFIREAKFLGASVIAVESYQRGTSDLKPQLRKIRRSAMVIDADPLIPFGGKMKRGELMKLVDHGLPLRRLDSLMARGGRVSATALLGPGGRRLVDSLGIPVEYDESMVDSLEIPVSGLQAIYVPISSPSEIGVVSSQIIYFHLDTQILGSGEWNNLPELAANNRYSREVLFESDSFVDSSSASYQEFTQGYAARFRKRPSRNAMYGYDAAQLLLSCIGGGAASREALVRALTQVRDFRGIRSRIGFSGRVNSWLTILRYSDDAIERVAEIFVE